MTNHVSTGMAMQVMASAMTNISWAQICPRQFQDKVLNLSPHELGQRMTAFFQNSCQMTDSGLGTITIDRTGKAWPTFGEEHERDERATERDTVDFSQVMFMTCQKDHTDRITAQEKIRRLEECGLIRLDVGVGLALFQEKGQATLRAIAYKYNITAIEFLGNVFHEDGQDLALSLVQTHEGWWKVEWYATAETPHTPRPTPVLAPF